MSPNRAPLHTPGPQDDQTFKAARRYIRRYPDHAVTFLASECNAVELLRRACAACSHKYFQVMADDTDAESETHSHSSHRRNLSSSLSHLGSSASTNTTDDKEPLYSYKTGLGKHHDLSMGATPHQPFGTHGAQLQQAPLTHEYTERSTASMAGYNRVNPNPRERLSSIASEPSWGAPIPNPSGMRTGPAPAGQARPSKLSSQDASGMTPVEHTGEAHELHVTVVCGMGEVGHKLQLDRSGEIFYESLKKAVKKTRKPLNRSVHSVKFTQQREADPNEDEACYWVSLAEDQVLEDWQDAVEWIHRTTTTNPQRVYAVIVQDDD